MHNDILNSSIKSKTAHPSDITGHIAAICIDFDYDFIRNRASEFSSRLRSELSYDFGDLKPKNHNGKTPGGMYRFGNTDNEVHFSETDTTCSIKLTGLKTLSKTFFEDFVDLFQIDFRGKVNYFAYSVDVPDGSHTFQDAYRFFFENFAGELDSYIEGINEISQDYSAAFHTLSIRSLLPDGLIVTEKGKELGLSSPWLEWNFMLSGSIPWHAIHDPRDYITKRYNSVDWIRNIQSL